MACLMLFGFVFSYIEERKKTEMFGEALRGIFIFSTGLIKTVGVLLIKDF